MVLINVCEMFNSKTTRWPVESELARTMANYAAHVPLRIYEGGVLFWIHVASSTRPCRQAYVGIVLGVLSCLMVVTVKSISSVHVNKSLLLSAPL